MGRFGQSVFYGFLLSFYFMCFYYAFGVFQTIFEHGDVVKFALDSIVVGIVIWVFASFACYELGGAFERINRPRDQDRKDDDHEDGGAPKGDGGAPTDGKGGNASDGDERSK